MRAYGDCNKTVGWMADRLLEETGEYTSASLVPGTRTSSWTPAPAHFGPGKVIDSVFATFKHHPSLSEPDAFWIACSAWPPIHLSKAF
jgi:hypothetical protein